LSLKESSDELNNPEVIPEKIARVGISGPLDYVALAIATFGVGFIPLAPGTWGSLAAIGIYLVFRSLFLQFGPITFTMIQLVTIAIVTVAGIWAASQVERITGRKDPGKVVVDEVAGQLISVLPVVFLDPLHSWKWMVTLSFILFRLFDIVKPYPARRMERLHGGLGIMCDDLVAGAYGFVLVLGAVVVLNTLT
jgi:phosphatidylglycerophosphatase A